MNIEYLYYYSKNDFNNKDNNEQEHKRFKKTHKYNVKVTNVINHINIFESRLKLNSKTFNSNFLKQPTNVIVSIVSCFDLFKDNEIYTIPHDVWVIIFSFILDTSSKTMASIVDRSLFCFQPVVKLDYNQIWNNFKKIKKTEIIEQDNAFNFQNKSFSQFKNDLTDFFMKKMKKNKVPFICNKTKYSIPISIKPIEKKKINNFFFHNIEFIIKNHYE